MSQAEGRTEKPTPKRKRDLRAEGRILSSPPFIATLYTAVAMGLVAGALPESVEALQAFLRQGLSVTPGDVRFSWTAVAPVLTPLILPLAGALAFCGAVQMFLAGGVLAPEAFGKRLGQSLQPWQRLGGLVKNAPKSLLASTLSSLLFLAFVTWLLWQERGLLVTGPFLGLTVGLTRTHQVIEASLRWFAFAALLAGSIDLYRQWKQHGDALKMTKEEVKREARESDGRPEVKAQQRRIRRELLRRKMMSDVSRASVVVTNPTHYAVALRYEMGQAGAPVVLAKGKNLLALLIRERATEAAVPLVENPPVAQALYRTAEVGQEIPANLYRVVAEILAYVHRLSRGGKP